MRLNTLYAVITVLVLSACLSDPSPITRTTENNHEKYVYLKGECRLESDRRLDSGAIQLRAKCNNEAAYLVALTELARAWRKDSLEIQSIHLGRLDHLIIGGPLGLSRRLARVSAKSSSWDTKQGKAIKVHSNSWVETGILKLGLFKEMFQPLALSGYEMIGVGVEKVRWIQAEKDPVLSREGLKGRLAWDALVHLTIMNSAE